MNTRLPFLLLLLLATLPAGGQTPVFRSQAVKELGIAQMSTVFQDRLGWLWFGGTGGLFRYDGLEFQPVSLPDSLADDPVTSIYEWHDLLWVGFKSGAIGFLPVRTAFLKAPHEIEQSQHSSKPLQRWMPAEGTPKAAISGFCPDSSGGLWIATYGEGLYCWKNERLYGFDPDDGVAGTDIYAIACDGRGRIWAATDAGISICSMPEPGKKKVRNLTKSDGLPDEITSALLTDQQGNVWIGMYDKGICRYNIRQDSFDNCTGAWPYGPVTSLAMFGSREIWAGTAQNGLIRVDLAYPPFRPAGAASALPEHHALRFEKILALRKDREGLLWVVGNKGNIYSANVRTGLLATPGGDVQAVCVDCHTRLWVGTSRGLFVQENGQFRAVLTKGQNVLSLWEAPDGSIWAGTFGDGVYILNAAGATLRHLSEGDGLTNGSVFSISGDQNRALLATLGGLNELQFKDYRLRTYIREIGTGYVYKVVTDSKGRNWIGTDGDGLVLLERDSFRHFSEAAGQPLRIVYCIAEDKRGNIWFSSDKAGLFCYDGQSFRHYTTKNHLHSMNINGLSCAGNGNIVVLYEDGFDLLTPETGHVAFYDPASGAPAIESNLNALCSDPGGNIWIGTKQGILRLTAFDEPFVFDPQPNITAVSIFLQPLDFLANNTFSYDRNYFLFNFTGLWYTNPGLVRYRYRLEGYDHDWVVSKENFASYPTLPPGHYVFHLQASEHGEFEGTPKASYAFVIRPPYWTRWWFILLCLAAAGGILYAFIHLREARFHREASLRRESVESQFETLKSQINPHFLFNSFNTLITIIEESPTMAVEYVEHLSDFYRSIMVYREKDLIPLNEEMELVQNFDFLLKKRYEDSFRLIEQVNGQTGFIMPLTLQMLVENAVKHNIISRARPLTVHIFVDHDDYIVVQNNNQRKVKPEPSTHFGLHSLKNRYALFGARPVIVEETEQFFTVKVPILQRNDA